MDVWETKITLMKITGERARGVADDPATQVLLKFAEALPCR